MRQWTEIAAGFITGFILWCAFSALSHCDDNLVQLVSSQPSRFHTAKFAFDHHYVGVFWVGVMPSSEDNANPSEGVIEFDVPATNIVLLTKPERWDQFMGCDFIKGYVTSTGAEIPVQILTYGSRGSFVECFAGTPRELMDWRNEGKTDKRWELMQRFRAVSAPTLEDAKSIGENKSSADVPAE